MPAPAKGKALSQGDVLKLVARLKASDDAKTQCGRRLIKFYEGIRR